MSFLLAAQQGPNCPFSLTAEHTPTPVLFLKQSGFISIWQWPPISFCPSGCSLSSYSGLLSPAGCFLWLHLSSRCLHLNLRAH